MLLTEASAAVWLLGVSVAAGGAHRGAGTDVASTRTSYSVNRTYKSDHVNVVIIRKLRIPGMLPVTWRKLTGLFTLNNIFSATT